MIDKVGTGSVRADRRSPDARWVTLAFTWNGLRALGVDEASLATFPEEFRAGHGGARGDRRSHRRQSPGSLGRRARRSGASRDRHPLRARRGGARALRARSTRGTCSQHRRRRRPLQPGSRGDRARRAREHFGYLDRLSEVPDRGNRTRAAARLGSRRQGRASSSSATPTRAARRRRCRSPSVLTRNGSYLAYLRLQEHVGAFRDFLRRHGRTRGTSRSSSPRS